MSLVISYLRFIVFLDTSIQHLLPFEIYTFKPCAKILRKHFHERDLETINRTRFLGDSAHPNAMGQFASPWPFTGWCGSNCILSPCLWLHLLEQPLYRFTFEWQFKIFAQMFSHWILGWSVRIRIYCAHLVENIFDLLVSTFINKKRNFFLKVHWEQMSFVTTFNILGSGRPFFPADDSKLFQCHSKSTRLWVTPKGPGQSAWQERYLATKV